MVCACRRAKHEPARRRCVGGPRLFRVPSPRAHAAGQLFTARGDRERQQRRLRPLVVRVWPAGPVGERGHGLLRVYGGAPPGC